MNKLVFLAVVVGTVALFMAQWGAAGSFTWEQLPLPAGYAIAYVLYLAYHRWRHGKQLADPVLVASVCALTGIGLACLARINPTLAWRQLCWLYLGIILFALMTQAPVAGILRKYTYSWAAIGIGLLLWPMIYGMEVRGARSWAMLGPLSFQPAEFAKILFVFALASYLSQRKVGVKSLSWRYVGPIGLMVVVISTILTLQRDLGTALLLFMLVVVMVSVATSSVKYLIGGILCLFAGGSAAVMFFDHVRTRFILWLDPWSFSDGRGYQLVESLFALGAGGLWGTGWGRGMADRIPIVESDFIYSLIVEELGLFGAAGVLFLLAVISLRVMALATESRREDDERLVAIGFGILLTLQTFLIVAGVTRLLPLTGVTLPFISYGGSSLLASFILTGMAYNLYVGSSESAQRKRVVASEGVIEWSKG